MDSALTSSDPNAGLRALVDAVGGEADVAWSRFGVDDLTDRLVLSQTLKAVSEALATSVVGRADRVAHGKAAGARTTDQVVARESVVAAADVRSDGFWARWLADFDEFAAGWLSGVLTKTHLKVLRAVDNPRTHALLVREQGFFVSRSVELGHLGFERAVQYWAIANDPDGAEPREQLRGRGVSMRRKADGTVTIKGELDALTGAAVTTVFNKELQKIRTADRDGEITRSQWSRGADALVAICSRAAVRSDGTVPAPLIDIVMSETVAENLLERLLRDDPADSLVPFPINDLDVDGRLELIDGTPIHPTFAMAAMAVGMFQTTVMGAADQPIRTSKRRLFPPALKHLMYLRCRGRCETPGCDAPFHWLHGDHIKPHSKGGETSIDDGQMICSPDNQAKADTWQDPDSHPDAA